MANDTTFWWMSKDPATVLQAHVRALRNEQSYRYEIIGKAMSSYDAGSARAKMTTANVSIEVSVNNALSEQDAKLNVIRSCVDTLGNRVTARQPAPKFLTSGAEWKLKRAAKNGEKFTLGIFYESDAYRILRDGFWDYLKFGIQAVKVYEDSQWDDDGKERSVVALDSVFPDELTFDEQETMHGPPKSLFQTKLVSRFSLAGQFSSKKTQILAASPQSDRLLGATPTRGEMLEVTEAWRLPSGRGKRDGRHVVVLGNVLLLDEKWTRDTFPFAIVRRGHQSRSAWGMGIPEEIRRLQFEINKTLKMISLALHHGSAPKWWVKANSVVKSHIDARIGTIVEYSGNVPPELRIFQSVSPELFKYLEYLYGKVYELVGISQMSASGQNEAGLKTGRAIRTQYDIESERFSSDDKNFEDLHLQVAKLVVAQAQEIAKRDGGYQVRVKGKDTFEFMDWAKDVGLEKDAFDLTIQGVSQLPSSAEGRMEFAQELLDMGAIEMEDFLQIINMTDLEGPMSRYTATTDLCDYLLEEMLDKGQYEGPEPFDDHMPMLHYMVRAYREAKKSRAPRTNLDIVVRYMNALMAEIKKAAAQAQPAPQSAGAPQGPPAALAA